MWFRNLGAVTVDSNDSRSTELVVLPLRCIKGFDPCLHMTSMCMYTSSWHLNTGKFPPQHLLLEYKKPHLNTNQSIPANSLTLSASSFDILHQVPP